MKRIALTLFLISLPALALQVPSSGTLGQRVGGSTFQTTDTGAVFLGVRNDGGSSNLAPTNLGYGPLAIDQQGHLWVNATVTAAAEQATSSSTGVTNGASLFKMIAGVKANGGVSTLQMDTTGAVYVDLGLVTAAQLSAIQGATSTVALLGATAANQVTGLATLTSINTGVAALAASLPLPVGAATSSRQDILGATVVAIQTSTFQTAASVVTLTQGKVPSDHIRFNYGGSTVTTTVYTTITTSLGGNCSTVDIFDSSGQTLVLSDGPSDSTTVDKIYIVPGGNGPLPLALSKGDRLSIKAVSASATAGELDINCYRYLP